MQISKVMYTKTSLCIATLLLVASTAQGGTGSRCQQHVVFRGNPLYTWLSADTTHLTYDYLTTGMLIPHVSYDNNKKEICLSLSCGDNTEVGTIAVKGLHEKFHQIHQDYTGPYSSWGNVPQNYTIWLQNLKFQVDLLENGIICIGAGNNAIGHNQWETAPRGFFIYNIATQHLYHALSDQLYAPFYICFPELHGHYASSVGPGTYIFSFPEREFVYVMTNSKNGTSKKTYNKDTSFVSCAKPLFNNTGYGILTAAESYIKGKDLNIYSLYENKLIKTISFSDASILSFMPLLSQNPVSQNLVIVTYNLSSDRNEILLVKPGLTQPGEKV